MKSVALFNISIKHLCWNPSTEKVGEKGFNRISWTTEVM